VKFTIKTFALALLIAGAVAIPASAESITWTFDDTTVAGSPALGSNGITLSNGSVLTGSFNYACTAAAGGTCDGVGDTGPDGLGTFSAVNINVSAGTGVAGGQTWYLLQNADDSASDNQSVFLTNFNPAYALSNPPDAQCNTGGGCATNGLTACERE
jgi:hypothetical protein